MNEHAARKHPNAEQLTAFDQGKLDPSQWSDVARHVAECDRCCRKLEAVPDDDLVRLMRAAAGERE